MSQIIVNDSSGTGTTPWKTSFPVNDTNKTYAFAIVGFTNLPITTEYKRAIQDTIQGYCNDPVRDLQCTTAQFFTELVRPDTGTGFMQVEVHTGTVLSDDEVATLETSGQIIEP